MADIADWWNWKRTYSTVGNRNSLPFSHSPQRVSPCSFWSTRLILCMNHLFFIHHLHLNRKQRVAATTCIWSSQWRFASHSSRLSTLFSSQWVWRGEAYCRLHHSTPYSLRTRSENDSIGDYGTTNVIALSNLIIRKRTMKWSVSILICLPIVDSFRGIDSTNENGSWQKQRRGIDNSSDIWIERIVIVEYKSENKEEKKDVHWDNEEWTISGDITSPLF